MMYDRFMKLSQHSPHLREEYSDKNKIPFDDLTHGSRKRCWWVCSTCSHEWEQDPNNRTNRKAGCPACKGKAVIAGRSDMASAYPNLVTEWSPKNDTAPNKVGPRSNKKAWWICPEGHEYEAVIANRTRGSGCFICSNMRASERMIGVPQSDRRTRRDFAVKNNPVLVQTLINEFSSKNNNSIEQYSSGSPEKVWWVCSKNHEWLASVKDRSRGNGCPRCCCDGKSKPELELATGIEELGLSINRNSRSVIPPYELDIYIPEKNIAIEFNGLYWHREEAKGRTYHYNKWKMCHEAGIQLITIWEDQWRGNREVVERMLRSKLGEDNRYTGARKTNLVELRYDQASQFLNKYHIQGSSKGTHYFGLTLNNELVAVSVWTERAGTCYLERYASSLTVIGGLDKMQKTLPHQHFTTFADLSVSNGRLYESTGWKLETILDPDYQYIVNDTRVHKFNFRKSRFASNPNLEYQEGLTERELASLNCIHRIYDCGKVKYTKAL